MSTNDTIELLKQAMSRADDSLSKAFTQPNALANETQRLIVGSFRVASAVLGLSMTNVHAGRLGSHDRQSA